MCVSWSRKRNGDERKSGSYRNFSKFIVVALCFCRAAVVSSGWAGACAGGRACVVVSIDAFVTAIRWCGFGVGVKCCEERNASFKQESIGGKEGTK